MNAHERVVRILRWIVVLPGALIGAGLLQLLFVVLYTLLVGSGDADSLTGRMLLRTFVNVVFGGATVGLARAIAPDHKAATATGVAVLFTIVSAAVWMARLDIGAEWDRYATIVSVVAAILTACGTQQAGDTVAPALSRTARDAVPT